MSKTGTRRSERRRRTRLRRGEDADDERVTKTRRNEDPQRCRHMDRSSGIEVNQKPSDGRTIEIKTRLPIRSRIVGGGIENSDIK